MEKQKNTDLQHAPSDEQTHTTEPLDNFWPEESVQEILDYIEEQGIYIRE